MTSKYRTELIIKIIEDLQKDKLKMEAGTLVTGWKYKFSIPQKDYDKLKKEEKNV